MGYTCTTCGRFHEEELRDVRAALPEAIFALSEDERTVRAVLSPGGDFATLDGEQHFVRALLELPIPSEEDAFGWGVWIRLGEEEIRDVAARWADSESAGRSYSGLLASELAVYGSTVGLPGLLTLRAVDRLPGFELEPCGHVLALEQRAGISLERARELAEPYQQAS
jgi:hypothetical protein